MDFIYQEHVIKSNDNNSNNNSSLIIERLKQGYRKHCPHGIYVTVQDIAQGPFTESYLSKHFTRPRCKEDTFDQTHI